MQKDKPTHQWLELSAEIENLKKFNDWVVSEAYKHKLSTETVSKIELALEEVLVNIINYAYQQESKGSILVQCGYTDESIFSITVKDRGLPFNPLKKKSPELISNIDERQIGGVGLILVKKVADKLEYTRTDDENILNIGFKT